MNKPVPRREFARPKFRSGVKSAAEIMADVAASGIPDDNEFTGPMGIRDSKEQRKIAGEIRDGR